MKKRFLTILVCAATSILITGCDAVKEAVNFREGEAVDDDSPRFVYTTDYDLEDNFRIIRDTETGVLYIMIIDGYRGGLSPLYDSDGNIVVENGLDD